MLGTSAPVKIDSSGRTWGRPRASSIGLSRLICSGTYGIGGFSPIITVRVTFEKASPEDEAKGIWDPAEPEKCPLGQFLSRMAQHQRFRAVPVQPRPGGNITWTTQRMDFSRHVHLHKVNGLDGLAALEARLANSQLQDLSIPWWEVHVVTVSADKGESVSKGRKKKGGAANGNGNGNGNNTGNGGNNGSPSKESTLSQTLLYVRIHHGIGDGVSLADACLEAVTDVDGKNLSLAAVFNPRSLAKKSGEGKKRRGGGFVLLNTLKTIASVVTLPLCFAGRTMQAALSPIFPRDGANWLNNPARTAFPPAAARQVPIYFASHKLDMIKTIRKVIDPSGAVTVNDVAFGILAGAFRRFYQRINATASESGVRPPRMRSLTPLAIPQAPLPQSTRYFASVRNMFTFVMNDLPVDQPDPVSRVRRASASWGRLKRSTIVPATLFVTRVASAFPLWARQFIARSLQQSTTVIFSNVPGPQQPVCMGGRRMETMHVLCPGVNPYFGLFSMNGWVYVSGTAYPDNPLLEAAIAKLPKAKRPASAEAALRQWLPECFEEELRELAAKAGIPQHEVDASISSTPSFVQRAP